MNHLRPALAIFLLCGLLLLQLSFVHTRTPAHHGHSQATHLYRPVLSDCSSHADTGCLDHGLCCGFWSLEEWVGGFTAAATSFAPHIAWVWVASEVPQPPPKPTPFAAPS